jgi:hypothetical protein
MCSTLEGFNKHAATSSHEQQRLSPPTKDVIKPFQGWGAMHLHPTFTRGAIQL